MKNSKIIATILCLVAFSAPSQAQLFKDVVKRAKQSVETKIKVETGKTVNKALDKTSEGISDAVKEGVKGNVRVKEKDSNAEFYAASRGDENNGKKIYVSKNGSNKNDGMSPATPLKDLQKAINNAVDGDVIMVAEGNYTGTLDQGFIDVNKSVSVIGGFNSDFSERNPFKYRSYIQTNPSHVTKNGSKALFEVLAKGSPSKTLVIDGFGFDLGEQNMYAAPNDDPRNGWPEGCLSGRIQAAGEPLVAKGVIGGKTVAHSLIHANVEGRFIVRNCVFANGGYYGLQGNNWGGRWEVCNNVFVSNSYASCQIIGSNKDANMAYVDFHHNTVLFSWCRTKIQEDMGYGFRFMSLVDADVHDNIFGGSNLGALDLCHHDPDKAKDAKRIINVRDNQFFMNKGDLILPSKSYMWLYIPVDQFEDVEDWTSQSGDKELTDQNFLNKISQPYLKGWMSHDVVTSRSYDENSPANLYRAAHGMNKMGTETVRVSMYGNKYPFSEAYDLFGALPGCGAQANF